jgi:serine/threonine protein kinase
MVEDAVDDDVISETSSISKVSNTIVSTKLRDGKKKINQYILLRCIGMGQFGKVRLVHNTEDDLKYAMKAVKKKKKLKGFQAGAKETPSELESVMQEIAIMKKLVSRHIS